MPATKKDEKGKFCGGHLKRWFSNDAIEQECGCIEKLGDRTQVYRCEICKTLYLPNPETARGVNVAGEGQLSVFGLTIPAKEDKRHDLVARTTVSSRRLTTKTSGFRPHLRLEHEPPQSLRPAGRVLLNDETLRDGLQSPSVRDPLIQDKIAILHLMESLGINSLNLGLPGAGPRAVEHVTALARNRRPQDENPRQLCSTHA